MALQVIAVPGAKIGSGTQLGTAIGGLAQIYSNLPAEAKKKIMGWFTDDDDEQSEHESAEEAEDKGKIARYESGASRNPDDWKSAPSQEEIEGTPEYEAYRNEMLSDAAAQQMQGYKPEESAWLVEGE